MFTKRSKKINKVAGLQSEYDLAHPRGWDGTGRIYTVLHLAGAGPRTLSIIRSRSSNEKFQGHNYATSMADGTLSLLLSVLAKIIENIFLALRVRNDDTVKKSYECI